MMTDDQRFWQALDLLKQGDAVRARMMFEEINTDDARSQLAYLYQMGLGGEVLVDESIALYRTLAHQGNADAAYALGVMLLGLNRPDEAIDFFALALMQGNCSASYWLAQIHDGYRGAARHPALYKQYLHTAAAQGHLFAERDVLRMQYQQSRGVVHKLKSGLKYRRAQWRGLWVMLRSSDELAVR